MAQSNGTMLQERQLLAGTFSIIYLLTFWFLFVCLSALHSCDLDLA